MSVAKKGGLGRGLDALFADVPVKEPTEDYKAERSSKNSVENENTADDRDAVKYIKIHDIMPNVNQPSTIELVKKSLNPSLKVQGVILSMFDGRTNLSAQVVQEVKKYFGGKVYSTVIPRNVRLAEAPSFGLPITEYDPKSRGAEAYTEFAEEFLELEEE